MQKGKRANNLARERDEIPLIIVYLDSQDFSHFAHPPRGKEAFYESLDQTLCDLIASKLIEVRYSAVHLSEIAQTSEAAAAYATDRARAIERFCQGKCMRLWQDILFDEFCATLTAWVVNPYSDNNGWIDVDVKRIGDFAENFKEAFHTELKARGFSRKQRRSIPIQSLVKAHLATPEGHKVIETISDQINSRFPLAMTLDVETLRLYLSGEIMAKRFETYLRQMLADPINLISRLPNEFEAAKKLPRLVRDIGKNLTESFEPVLINLQMLAERMPSSSWGSHRADLLTHIAELRQKIRRKAARANQGDLPRSLRRSASRLSDESIDAMRLPGLDVIVDSIAAFLKDAVSAAAAQRPIRQFRPSDAPDMMHGAYIPYVDLFRCDTAWADTFKKASRRPNSVIGRIEDLRPALEKLLPN